MSDFGGISIAFRILTSICILKASHCFMLQAVSHEQAIHGIR